MTFRLTHKQLRALQRGPRVRVMIGPRKYLLLSEHFYDLVPKQPVGSRRS